MSFNLKLGNDFLHIPRLPADGKGFVVWKKRPELLIQACGLYGHLDGTIRDTRRLTVGQKEAERKGRDLD